LLLASCNSDPKKADIILSNGKIINNALVTKVDNEFIYIQDVKLGNTKIPKFEIIEIEFEEEKIKKNNIIETLNNNEDLFYEELYKLGNTFGELYGDKDNWINQFREYGVNPIELLEQLKRVGIIDILPNLVWILEGSEIPERVKKSGYLVKKGIKLNSEETKLLDDFDILKDKYRKLQNTKEGREEIHNKLVNYIYNNLK
jgi:hypothetical protein